MPNNRSSRAVSPLLCACLASCGLFAPDKPAVAPMLKGTASSTESVALGNGYGLNMPRTLDGFVRVDTEDRSVGRDFVAGYARTVDPAPVMATIRAHRLSEGGGSLNPLVTEDPNAAGAKSDAALKASIAQVYRFYPDATIADPVSNAYIVRFGAMQFGRQVTMRYVDVMDGVRQPIRLQVDTFCCLDGKWSYEYRFRSPDSLNATAAIAKFLRDIPWSADPASSIDPPA